MRAALAAALMPLLAAETAALTPLDDTDLSAVVAQGLFVSDHITGSELTGSNAYSQPFDFYRMGLDGELALNLNLSKLQLGCGGVNDFISASKGCDVDLDYATFMGKNVTGNGPGDPLSDFLLKRPYIELAIKNADSPSLREVVGIKIGAEQADGAISVGRRYYNNGAINQENTAVATTCDTGASVGNGVLGCHSGINSVSGFLGAEMSITMRVRANVCLGGLIGNFCLGVPIPLDAYGCKGRTATTVDDCGTALSDALFVDVAGTRMSNLSLRAAQLSLEGQNIVGDLADALLGNAYASLNADLRAVHHLVFDETSDFFLSFQREPVAYPRYAKDTPTNTLPPGAFDSCNSAYATARCDSAYAVPANTGWWLNAPAVKLLDVNGSASLGNLSLGDALSLLAAPGYTVSNPEFNLSPAQNCYGASQFC
ncbi:MAG: hypothetical protein ACPG43_01345 [Alcanivoracaceae bacterium]